MSSSYLALNDQIYTYLLNTSLREPALLQQLRAETATMPAGNMQISPIQGQFMGLLLKIMRAVNTIEIGVFTGYSTLCTALALPAEGHTIACDVSEEWTAIARRYWAEAGIANKIDLRLAPATQTLETLRAEGREASFDFVFIDADKGNYDAYYEGALPLVRPGGVIAFDNTLWYGKVADQAVQDSDTIALRAINQKLQQDMRVTMSQLPLGDGLTLVLKNE